MSRAAISWTLSLAVTAMLLAAGCGNESASRTETRQAPAAAATTATTAVATPTARVATRRSHAAVPILMYHVIATATPGTSLPELWVPAANFADQMRALDSAGYEAVTLTNVLDAWAGHAKLPPHPIVVSFDDGYLSQGQAAATVLRSHHWPGVLNLALHNLGTDGGLTKSRIRTMLADGWELGAHSLTHAD